MRSAIISIVVAYPIGHGGAGTMRMPGLAPEGLADVCVGVDKTGNEQATRAVERVAGITSDQSGSKLGYAAVVDANVTHLAAPGANGNHSYGPIPVPAGVKLQVTAQRTDGDATSALLAKGTLIKTG